MYIYRTRPIVIFGLLFWNAKRETSRLQARFAYILCKVFHPKFKSVTLTEWTEHEPNGEWMKKSFIPATDSSGVFANWDYRSRRLINYFFFPNRCRFQLRWKFVQRDHSAKQFFDKKHDRWWFSTKNNRSDLFLFCIASGLNIVPGVRKSSEKQIVVPIRVVQFRISIETEIVCKMPWTLDIKSQIEMASVSVA